MAEEIKFSQFTAADPATLEAAGGIVPSAVPGIGNNKSTWTQIKNWISNPLLVLINKMVDKTQPMLQIMIGGLRAVYFSARWFEMDIEDSQPTSVKGAMWYGSDDNLPNVNLDYGVTGSLLDDVITPAINKTGSVIPNGTVCYVSGSQGNRAVVSLAQAVLTPTTQVAVVVATHDVANNTLGYFVNRGLVNQLNTSAYTEGQILWVSTTAGQLTGTAPAKPYSQIAVGVVTRVHATVGQIRVFPFPTPRLGQLTDVDATGIVAGQALRLNSSGVFEPYTPLELGETSSTAYRGDRGKVAYDHSQTTGNPHGTEFSELENKPTTLAGYGITDATVKRSVTVSTSAGWYRLGYVDLVAGAQNRVFGNISYAGCGSSGYMGFAITRAPSTQTLEVSQVHQISCGVAPSVQWEILGDGTTIRLSFYCYLDLNHSGFSLYNIGGSVPLTNAYTHEYIGATKPANTELTNRLDRVTLTDEPAQDVLPSGNMTQPTAIQWLRNNVKQIFTALTNKLDRVIDSGRLLISYSGVIRIRSQSNAYDFSPLGLFGPSPANSVNDNVHVTAEWVRRKFVPNSIGTDITSSATITPADGELRKVTIGGTTVTLTNTPLIGTISYLGMVVGCAPASFKIAYTGVDGTSYTFPISSYGTGDTTSFLKTVRLIKGATGWIIEE